jgi:hypothetical protein
MTNKFFLLVASAFLMVFGLGVAAVVGITSMTDHATVAADDVTVKAPAAEAASQPAVVPLTGDVQIRPAPEASSTPAPAPVSAAVIVGMDDINRLASAVHLGDISGAVTKDVWSAQLPVAQKLLDGMCDCDQRNWLNHFVETAQEAVSGSQHYQQSIQVLAKLRRANSDLASANNSR